MGTNILFWNCQGIRQKHNALELYLEENEFDVIALNETFLSEKHNFKIPGHDTIRNDHSAGLGDGVALLLKHGLVVNKEYRDNDFNIITDNEALAIDLELSNKQNLTLATTYCPNGKLNLTLIQTINNLSDNVMFVGDFNSKLKYQTINNLSDNVMFVGDFNSKLKYFGCAKKALPFRSSKISKNNLTLFT